MPPSCFRIQTFCEYLGPVLDQLPSFICFGVRRCSISNQHRRLECYQGYTRCGRNRKLWRVNKIEESTWLALATGSCMFVSHLCPTQHNAVVLLAKQCSTPCFRVSSCWVTDIANYFSHHTSSQFCKARALQNWLLAVIRKRISSAQPVRIRVFAWRSALPWNFKL